MDQTPWEHIQNKLRKPNQPENEALRNWLDEDAENKEVMDDLKVIYSITGNAPDSFVPQKEQAWSKIISRINIPKTQSGIVRFMVRVAASILLIALGVGGSYLFQGRQMANSYTEVYSPFGHKTMVVLPDNSKVWLNGDSRLKYNTDFSDSRNVELSGEALFEVIKNPGNLFTVKSKDIRIEVYGTTFNVQSYDNDVVSEIALVEGSVGLFHDEQLLRKMIPGEVISYDAKANKFSSQQGNINQITSWKSDELIIENETFESMVKYLERWYGVEITLDQSLRQNLRLSFKVKTESLIELLSIIDHITPVSYEINGKQVKIMKRTNRKS
ncbi:MAG: FecR domain-containing protein [Prolixibacteraceae bacterium]|nr:FecR domain-containing protein [Prolixibacteraceae bacterium]